ncbi:MAG: ion transporter [Aureispira sp.]|nr:ion transporter [Aureispira sp.]
MSSQKLSTNAFKNFFLNDKNILALITLNALVIFLQGFRPDEIGEQVRDILVMSDDLISILFFVEVVVKGTHYGFKQYLKSTWNKFDVLLIFLSLPPIIIRFFPIEAVNVSFLLVFRVFRVFKFFRFIQFFPQVEHIFRSVQEALKASFMVLVGFLVFVFIMAILSCFFYQDTSPDLFGNPIKSYYTIFQIFTVEGWNAIPDIVCKNAELGNVASFFTKMYFMVLLILGGIFGLSIVNSIFVDAMVSDNNDELEEQVTHIEKEVVDLKTKVDRILELLEDKTRDS